MTKLGIRKATLSDAINLASRLRPEDTREVYSASGRSGLQALSLGVTGGTVSYSVVELESGLMVFMFGVGPTERRTTGSPWMLASNLVRSHSFAIARQTVEAVELLHNHYPILMNAVDARNTLHIQWLKWAGFHFIGETPAAHDGSPFLEFVRIRDVRSSHHRGHHSGPGHRSVRRGLYEQVGGSQGSNP